MQECGQCNPNYLKYKMVCGFKQKGRSQILGCTLSKKYDHFCNNKLAEYVVSIGFGQLCFKHNWLEPSVSIRFN